MTGEIEGLFLDRFGLSHDRAGLSDLRPDVGEVLGRRTHRAYSPDPVPDTLINALLAVSFSASSKSDFQQASVIVVKSRSSRDEIAAYFPRMPWIGLAPKFLVFCGDTRRLERLGGARSISHSNRDLEGFFNASVDAALVLQTFILSAERQGLGCCPISVVRNRMPEVAGILGLPDGVFAVAGLCVGYPSGTGQVSMRLPMSVTVHSDRYDDTNLLELVQEYDARREARFPTPVANQRNPGRFGVSEAYGWSEDKSRQMAEAEGAAFGQHLTSTGFFK